MMPIAFPPAIWPTSISFTLEMTSRSGGVSITGSEQVVAISAGRWRASGVFPMRSEPFILGWRAFVASLDGRAGTFEISPFDFYRPADINGRKVSGVAATAPFLFDGTGFAQDDRTDASLAAAASLGVTRIAVDAAAPWMVPMPGQYFGISGRLHIATRVYRATEADPWTLDFRPGLRASASVGTRVVTDRPTCLMRFADDATGTIELAMRQRGTASVNMVEAF